MVQPLPPPHQPTRQPVPPAHRPGVRAWAGQVVLYGLFALFIGVFSHGPSYRHLAPDRALLKLSLVHTGKPVSDCRTLPLEELAKLPPNMRAPTSCPRERSTVTVELDIDGKPAVRVAAPPSGLSRDGASAVYERLPVSAGERLLQVRLRDDVRSPGFAYTLERRVTLAPAQVLVIDFDAERGGITLQ
jgi:hypothetical protein